MQQKPFSLRLVPFISTSPLLFGAAGIFSKGESIKK